jgi:hypothetical protein
VKTRSVSAQQRFSQQLSKALSLGSSTQGVSFQRLLAERLSHRTNYLASNSPSSHSPGDSPRALLLSGSLYGATLSASHSPSNFIHQATYLPHISSIDSLRALIPAEQIHQRIVQIFVTAGLEIGSREEREGEFPWSEQDKQERLNLSTTRPIQELA